MDFELFLGRSREGVPLWWDMAGNSHIYLSGQSGQGKSFLLRRLMEQLPPQGVRCIVFDCSGDFRQAAQGGGPWTVRDVRRAAKIDPFRRMPLSAGYWEENQDLAARVAGAVTDSYAFAGRAQPVYLRNALADFLDAYGAEPSIPAFLSWISGDERRAARMSGLLERLKDLNRVFPADAAEMDWRLDEPGITVLQFYTVPDPALQVVITEFLLAGLWSEKLQAGGACPVVAVLDECHRFPFRSGSMPMRILREGRKYQVSGWFASQWMDDKAAVAALDQAALRAYFYPGDRNVGRLARLLCSEPGRRGRVVSLIRALEVGDFLYQSGKGAVLRGRMPREERGRERTAPI